MAEITKQQCEETAEVLEWLTLPAYQLTKQKCEEIIADHGIELCHDDQDGSLTYDGHHWVWFWSMHSCNGLMAVDVLKIEFLNY